MIENTINKIVDLKGNKIGYLRVVNGEVSFRDPEQKEWHTPNTETEKFIVQATLTDIGMIQRG